MADCRRAEKVPAAIGLGKKRYIRSIYAGLCCGLAATLALAQSQALAQMAPWNTLTQPTPTPSGTRSPFISPITPDERRLRLSGALDLAEGYTTNATGTSTAKPDTFTRGRFDLGVHYAAPRLNADAHYSMTGYYYSQVHDSNQLINRLNLVAQSELVPDHLFLNVTSFAAPTVLSRVGPLSANEGLLNINNRQSYGYLANPVLKLRFGDYVTSQTSLSEGQVFFVPTSTSSTDSALPITPVGDTTSISATERISSGPSFGRLKWNLTASYTNVDQTTQSEQESIATLDVAYALNREIAALAIVGYDHFQASVPLTQALPAPVALAGLRFSYGPTFSLYAAAGIAHGSPTFLGSLNWNATAKFKIVGSLTDTITTPQANILNNLSTLAVSAEGVFSDSQSYYWQTGAQALYPQFATVSPVPVGGLALDNSISHDRRAQLAFLHDDERTQYGLSFFGDQRDRLNAITEDIPSRSWVYGVQLSATRKLRRDLTGYAGVSYSYAAEFGGNDRIIGAYAGLTYMLSKDLDCYITGRYLQRQSNGQIVIDVPFSETVGIVGIRRSF